MYIKIVSNNTLPGLEKDIKTAVQELKEAGNAVVDIDVQFDHANKGVIKYVEVPAEVTKQVLVDLESVLCNPEGKACIQGSEEDLKIIDRALEALRGCVK